MVLMPSVTIHNMNSCLHLGKVLVDGSQGLTPWRVLHQDAEVGVGEPATPHPLPLGNAKETQEKHFC